MVAAIVEAPFYGAPHIWFSRQDRQVGNVCIMNIGVAVADACEPAFKSVSQKKARFALFKVEGQKEVVPAQVGERDANIEDFFKVVSENAPVYGVFDYEWKTDDGCQKSKIIFVSFVPDTLKPMEKMVYAGAKTSLMQAIKLTQDLHIAAVSDLNEDAVKKAYCK
jgi:cofilin